VVSTLPAISHHERISVILRHLKDIAAHAEEQVSVGYVLQVFGRRGFAFLLLVLSLLNIVIFMVPMISVLFGLPMVILAVQMILGLPMPVFPEVINRRTIPREALVQGLDRAIFWVEKIERYIRPRLLFLTGPHIDRAHAVLALVLAIMVTLPIPVFNVPPSIGLFFLAVGMLQPDGLFIILAYTVGVWCLWLFKSLGHVVHALRPD
jgi:hypothetical protein